MSKQQNNSNGQLVWMAMSFALVGFILGFMATDGDLSFGEANVVDTDETPTVEIVEEPGLDFDALEFLSVSADDDAIKGDPNAPITIVEFSDYECPYCERFYYETMPLLVENYIDTGLVNLVYRDLPLSFHANAANAALAAECVGENGDDAYYEMHDALFERSSEWSGVEDTVGALTGIASDIGYEIATCMSDAELMDEINDDITAARSYGLSGTPSFFINGNKLVGAYPYETFEAIIENELSQL